VGATSSTIGIDVGGTKILAVLRDDAGEVLGERRTPTPPTGEGLLTALVEVVAGLGCGAAAVGVGLPGLVDREGTLRFAPNLPGVVELPVGRRLAEATALPVRVDNDATCALWAEHQLGAGQGSSDVVLVTLGTGIGGGLVLDGRLLRGAHGFAGEIGHMVVDFDGVACPCGRRGCWERYASGSALGRLGREAAEAGRAPGLVELAGGDPARIRGEHCTAAAVAGDPGARAVVTAFAGWFALGLANLVHVLDVRRTIVGGGLVEAGDVLLDPIRAAFAERLVAPDHRPPVEIVPARLGSDAGAVGAALLAREALG
jgi:glucokinase